MTRWFAALSVVFAVGLSCGFSVVVPAIVGG